MTEEDEANIEMLMALDLTLFPEWAAKKFRLVQERPDLVWLADDTAAEKARKTAEFDALMLTREVKH